MSIIQKHGGHGDTNTEYPILNKWFRNVFYTHWFYTHSHSLIPVVCVCAHVCLQWAEVKAMQCAMQWKWLRAHWPDNSQCLTHAVWHITTSNSVWYVMSAQLVGPLAWMAFAHESPKGSARMLAALGNRYQSAPVGESRRVMNMEVWRFEYTWTLVLNACGMNGMW